MHKLKTQQISGTAIYSTLCRTHHSLTPRITRIRQSVPLHTAMNMLHSNVDGLNELNELAASLHIPTVSHTTHSRYTFSYLTSHLTEEYS